MVTENGTAISLAAWIAEMSEAGPLGAGRPGKNTVIKKKAARPHKGERAALVTLLLGALQLRLLVIVVDVAAHSFFRHHISDDFLLFTLRKAGQDLPH